MPLDLIARWLEDTLGRSSHHSFSNPYLHQMQRYKAITETAVCLLLSVPTTVAFHTTSGCGDLTTLDRVCCDFPSLLPGQQSPGLLELTLEKDQAWPHLRSVKDKAGEDWAAHTMTVLSVTPQLFQTYTAGQLEGVTTTSLARELARQHSSFSGVMKKQ